MPLNSGNVKQLIALFKTSYPNWQSFSNPVDPDFVKEEIEYKKNLIQKAEKQISKDALKNLLLQATENPQTYDEFLGRFKTVGRSTNLLYLAAPSTGDLGILHQPELNKPEFCNVLFDLLYGQGESEERLGRYLKYVAENGLPNKWTFPTLFLFVCDPENDIFVKPTYFKTIFDFLGEENKVRQITSANYASIKAFVRKLKDELQAYEPRDNVDIQSFIWVCSHKLSKDRSESIEVAADCPFSPQTFELLTELQKTPKKSFYDAHKDEFKSQIESPFKEVFRQVANCLPATITNRMEIQTRIFASILKNDYGQGGAWDFFWGAFYTKGGRRIADAQLFMWISGDRLEFGFYIGEYGGQQRQQFLNACRAYSDKLASLLEPTLNTGYLLWGSRADIITTPDGNFVDQRGLSFQDWLHELAQPDIKQFDVHVAVVHSKKMVLSLSTQELVTQIVQTFEQLFPLVLLAIEPDPIPAILEYLDISEEADDLPHDQDAYSLEECAAEIYVSETQLRTWVKALERKKQAVLYGPPGTGKTFIAQRLAKHLTSEGDGFIDTVQFHPAYTYEDFIQGIRPRRVEAGLDYPTIPGRFLEFCNKARKRRDRCVLIIDEVNRANLSQVFGELMYLLEYRDDKIYLASGEEFSIPSNVRIIGTMNTADRSIALVDHALRRRFAFLYLPPNYDGLEKYHFQNQTGYRADKLATYLRKLNTQIGDRHYEIGTSFFLRNDLQDHISSIWQLEIEPYLEEFFFDQPDRVEAHRWEQVREDLQ